MRNEHRALIGRGLIALLVGTAILAPAWITPSAASVRGQQARSEPRLPQTSSPEKETGHCWSARRKRWVEGEGWVIRREPKPCLAGLGRLTEG
jgi:hypothetical protein